MRILMTTEVTRTHAPSCVTGLLAAVLVLSASAASALESVTARSTSGQFTVRGLPLGAPAPTHAVSGAGYLRLDPVLTAVSLERIRQAVAAELDLRDEWRGPVQLTTFPVREAGAPVTVTSVHFANGWGYRIEMPELVDKARFIRTAVSVILMEFANRHAVTREAELPPWLAEGLSAVLESSTLPTLAIEPGTDVARAGTRPDPLLRARELVRGRGALTFTQLSLPSEADLAGEHYRACAHLFVHELLRLRGGREAMRGMLARLPRHLNWQTAFFQSFQAYFPRPIDADKWHLLNATHAAGRDTASQWPPSVAIARLEEILSTTVEVRAGAATLPVTTAVKLQRLIAEWEFARQAPVLEQKLGQLELLQTRSPGETALLVAAYRQALSTYLQARTRPTRETKLQAPANPRLLAHETARRLDVLDGKFDKLRGRLGAEEPDPPRAAP